MMTAIEKMMFNSLGVIHFIGIGGIGMSGIAEILHNIGYQVQGSDQSESDNVTRLRNLGIRVFVGHNEENIASASVVVKSTAIKNDNPEIIAARKRRIPVVKRSEMLAELMRLKVSVGVSGSHGKTTTTAFVAAIFEAAELNPTVINGGIINTRETNAYLGSGDYLIAEADESDGTFIRIPSTIAVITNIDPEHLDYYGSFENLISAYHSFIHNIPFYGFAVACKDHKVVADLISDIQDREIITYGIDQKDLDIRAFNIKQNVDSSVFDVEISERINGQKTVIENIILPVPGRHNVSNSLAAIAIGTKLGFKSSVIKDAFAKFKGVKRRFTKTGEVSGAVIIDDYAHHPEEIKATLETASQVIKNDKTAKIYAIFQPHRYSRVENLFSEFIHSFDMADSIFVADIYSAGEKPINGINKEVIISTMRNYYEDNKEINGLESVECLAKKLKAVLKKGDIVLFLGAGTSSKWAYEFPQLCKNI